MATTLTTLPNSGIQVNTELLDITVLEQFSKNNFDALSIEQANTIVEQQYQSTEAELDLADIATEGLSQDDDVDSVIEKVASVLQEDEEYADLAAAKLLDLKATSKQNIVASFNSQPTQELLNNNQNSLVITKQENAEQTVLSINGEQAVIIPKADRGSALAVSLEMILAWTFLIWHSVSFIATAISFFMPAASNAKVKGVSQTVQKSSSAWSKFVARMKAVAAKVSASERIQRLIHAFKVINVFRHLKAVVTAILSHMSKWEKFVAVVDFLASVALLFITAGASLVRKLIKMAVDLVHVIDDIIHIVDLEKRKRVEPAAA